MNHQPNWRIPFGILVLLLVLTGYALIIARYLPEIIGEWHILVQTMIYLLLGVAWLPPLRRFLIWMEAGRGK